MPKNKNHQIKTMTREKKNVENKKSLIDKILSKKEIIVTVAGGLTAFYPIINAVYNFYYQNRCEVFYHLPEKYFHSNINNSLLYLCSVIILLFSCIIPMIMKKYDEKNGNLTKGLKVYYFFLTIIIGTIVGLLNVFNLVEIMKQTYNINSTLGMIYLKLDIHPNITVLVVTLLWLVALIGVINVDKIRSISCDIVKGILSFVVVISFVISLMIMIRGTIIKLSVTVEDKTKYEIVNINEESYVVLSECDDKLLVVPYEVTDDGQCIFKTKQYMFIDMYDGIYQYVDICSSPIIEYK